ncbi:MAG: c-type cytochrome [Arenicellaceae bacterium]|nr:c-type cytochrome [Arenicellaceae bacterium]
MKLKVVKSLRVCIFGLATVASVSTVSAQQYPVSSDEGVDGEELFAVCGFCHGMQGQGGPALDAPPLAGMEAWYIERQLKAFKSRVRGMHPEDVPGMQMSIVSGMVRNDVTISNVARYIESLTPGAAPELARGEVAGTARPFIWRSEYAKLEHSEPADAVRGAEIYNGSCAACHGTNGEGSQILGSPRLTDLSVAYSHRQLQYFKNGVRGSNSEDVYGAQMASFAKLLADEQAIADVVAYIDSIEADK